MAITTNATTVMPFKINHDPVNAVPFCVNATSADASGCEEIMAAPGAGYALAIESLSVSTDDHITVTVGEDENSGAVKTVLFGPIPFSQEVTGAGYVQPGHWQRAFKNPIKLAANKPLTVDASGAGNICVVVEGCTVTG